jgi:DUF2934 family protein
LSGRTFTHVRGRGFFSLAIPRADVQLSTGVACAKVPGVLFCTKESIDMGHHSAVIKNTASSEFVVVSDDPIAERAHEIYVERGCVDGLDREDWFRAERELEAMPAIAPKRGSTPVKKTVKHPKR